MKKVKICKIPFKIKEVPTIDEGVESGIVQGKIYHSEQKILIRKSLSKKLKEQVLIHEIVHGMLVQIGYDNLSNDEVLVQNLSIAINDIFKLKGKKNGK